MNTKKIIQLSLVGALCATSAYAEMVQGMITNIDPARNQLSIRQTVPAKNTPQQLDVMFRDDTKTKNVDSVQDLLVGQEVRVDIKKDKEGNLIEARSIEVTEVQPLDQARRDLNREVTNAEIDAQSAPSAAESSSVGSSVSNSGGASGKSSSGY